MLTDMPSSSACEEHFAPTSMSDTDVPLQDEELQVLDSIYPDYISERTSSYLRLEVPVELGHPRDVYLTNNANSEAASSATELKKKLAHLPPIILAIKLPESYPSSTPPLIFALHSIYNWFTCCAKLLQHLRETWTEGEGVLCTWVELIRSGDFLEKLGLIDTSDSIRFVLIYRTN